MSTVFTKKAIADFDAIPKNKPTHPLRVGVVGEYFTIMDPYSNHEIEKKTCTDGCRSTSLDEPLQQCTALPG